MCKQGWEKIIWFKLSGVETGKSWAWGEGGYLLASSHLLPQADEDRMVEDQFDGISLQQSHLSI